MNIITAGTRKIEIPNLGPSRLLRGRGAGEAFGEEQTVTLQPDGTDGIDTFLQSNQANTNKDGGALLAIGDDNSSISFAYRTLIKFDLSSIPEGSQINEVTLSLYESFAEVSGAVTSWAATLHRVLRAWVENQATWNIYSTGNSWGTAGAGEDGVDRVATASATLTLDGTVANDFVSWTGDGLKDDVQGWIDGDFDNNGWLLQAPDAEFNAGESANYFASSDEATAANRPKLQIKYQAPL